MPRDSEKFCLRWNDFCSNLGAALEEVREEKELYDVTVACEGGGEFPAHRLVLSACSQVMRQILCRKSQLGGRHHQEVVYLRGVASQDLQHILTFMYCGEVSIAQEQINSFLAVAEDLQVKGLTQEEPGKPTSDNRKDQSRSQSNPSAPVSRPRQDRDSEEEEVREIAAVKAETGYLEVTGSQLAPTEDHMYQDDYGPAGGDQIVFYDGKSQGDICFFFKSDQL